jgi:acetyl-CoA acyltransferase 1
MILFMKIVDPKTGEEKKIIVSVDDGFRPNANLTDLAKLKPAFRKDGSTTAGTPKKFSC